MTPTAADRRPYSRVAMQGFLLSLAALGWSLAAAFAGESWPLASLAGPAVLGLVSLYLGSHGLHAIEASRDQLSGEGAGVFAVMIGMLAFVTGAVATFAAAVWPVL